MCCVAAGCGCSAPDVVVCATRSASVAEFEKEFDFAHKLHQAATALYVRLTSASAVGPPESS